MTKTLTFTNCTSCILLDKHDMPERLDVFKTIEWLKENVPVRTILETGEMLFYYNGIYISGGEQYISRILTEHFGGINKDSGAPIYNKHVKSEILTMLKDSTYTEIAKFDSDLSIINMENGLYNWQTGEFLQHTPDYYSVIQIPVRFDPDARCPNIDKMIQTVADEKNVTKCYEMIAYCLYREYPIQKMFVLFGPGGTGKSHFMDVVKTILGESNCSYVSLQDMTKDRFASSDLYKKMANICGDLDNTIMYQVNTIKQITSNKDVIRAQKKGEKSFNFINYAKPIFGANHLPASKDDTSGFYRRFEIIPFMHVFTDKEFNQEFLSTLTSDAEISGLFNKVISILGDLLTRNAFTNQLTIEDTKLMYKDRSAPEESFFDQFVVEMPGETIAKNVLAMYFNEYCKILGLPKKSMSMLGRYITTNVEWVKKRAIYENKEDHKSNYSAWKDGKTVAVWPDTMIDFKKFIEWKKANSK